MISSVSVKLNRTKVKTFSTFPKLAQKLLMRMKNAVHMFENGICWMQNATIRPSQQQLKLEEIASGLKNT